MSLVSWRSRSRPASSETPGRQRHADTVPDELQTPWDVVVIGGGNAALVSALSARDVGASVLVLERAPAVLRGGNSRHTRNIRCVHEAADDYNSGAYRYEEMWADLCGVGSGPNDEAIAAFTVEDSRSVPAWMNAHGVMWQQPLNGTLHLGRTNRFFLGGGKALLNSYYRRAEQCGVHVLYGASVERLELDGDICTSITVTVDGAQYVLRPKAIVCASGGFEANVEWLERYWGKAAHNYHIRGPVYNDGTILDRLLEAGAETAGEERGFHAVAVDARSPKFDGGIATRLDNIPFGIVVNRDGQRFYDEGEDLWPKRYAMWGTNIAMQPDQIAYGLWDSKISGLFLPPMYRPYRAATITDLARQLGLDPRTLEDTVAKYNAALPQDAWRRFNPAALDGVATSGISPQKSNWALPFDTPPFFAAPMRPGITFTYLGVRIDETARVRRKDGTRFQNVFAAGEIMSGNILSTGYLAGFGMTIGTVWGRVAGREAGQQVHG
jgi:tricarballylate dehydrogenase